MSDILERIRVALVEKSNGVPLHQPLQLDGLVIYLGRLEFGELLDSMRGRSWCHFVPDPQGNRITCYGLDVIEVYKLNYLRVS